MSDSIDILGLTLPAFVEAAGARGVRPPHARACYHAAFREGRALAPWIRFSDHEIVSTEIEGATTKFCQRHPDGLETESVLIPMLRKSGHTTHTLCVSSQVGCAMGCRFCETAQMGLMKNLTSADIVAQWFAATYLVGLRPKNIVFMGMGEPMDNLDAVLDAIRILTQHDAAEVPPSNITVSTVGRVDGMRRFAEFVRNRGFHRVNLAVSLNAPNDAIRSSIMPINRKYPMAELREEMLAFPPRSATAICVEYVLIPGVNDGLDHCDELCAYLRGIRCSLNVIPYNPRRDSPWPAPDEASVEAFLLRAMANGQFVKRRRTKGRSVMGACGQLGNPQIRRRRWTDPVTLSVAGQDTRELVARPEQANADEDREAP